MEKYNILMREYPNETTGVLETLYNEKFPKSKKPSKAPNTTFKFKALGKVYDEKKVVRNYISFFSDVSKIIPFDEIRFVVGSSYFSTLPDVFPEKERECINGEYYINTKTSTERKKIHVEKVCEYLDINMVEIGE